MNTLFDVILSGQGLETFGLVGGVVGEDEVDGVGLVTFGLIWVGPTVWTDVYAAVNTIWVPVYS